METRETEEMPRDLVEAAETTEAEGILAVDSEETMEVAETMAMAGVMVAAAIMEAPVVMKVEVIAQGLLWDGQILLGLEVG